MSSSEVQKILVAIAEIKKDIDFSAINTKEIKSDLEKHYLTRQEFEPYKKVLVLVATTVIIAVVTAILSVALPGIKK